VEILYGLSLWPSPDDYELDVSSEPALSIARDVIAHCPLLQHVSWIDGTPLTIVNENGVLQAFKGGHCVTFAIEDVLTGSRWSV
jgi:hypothetical protein